LPDEDTNGVYIFLILLYFFAINSMAMLFLLKSVPEALYVILFSGIGAFMCDIILFKRYRERVNDIANIITKKAQRRMRKISRRVHDT